MDLDTVSIQWKRDGKCDKLTVNDSWGMLFQIYAFYFLLTSLRPHWLFVFLSTWYYQTHI